MTRQQLREAVAKLKAGRPKHYVFAYRPTTKAFSLKLSFTKSRATRDEVIDALEAILREFHRSKITAPRSDRESDLGLTWV